MIFFNVFGYEKNVNFPKKSENYKKENIVDLLLINKDGEQHYCVIKNLGRLISSQHNEHHRKNILVEDA